MTLSNVDLENIAKQMKLPLIGVYSKDRLPEKRYIGSYIVNMQNYDEGNGSHWVYILITDKDKGKAIYFDSFGVSPPQEIQDFLKPFSPYAVNNRMIQDIKSTKCGLYCIACDIYFKYYYNKKKSIEDNFDDFLNILTFKTDINDDILYSFLKKQH